MHHSSSGAGTRGGRGAVRLALLGLAGGLLCVLSACDPQADASALTAATSPPPCASSCGSGSVAGYENPFRSVSGLVPERVDQGVDYGGTGPVYAVGSGVVMAVIPAASAGWDGGPYICYQLTGGPAQNDSVYIAEGISPSVHVGEQVGPATVIGNMTGASSGIETGWGLPTGESLARFNGQAARSGDPGSDSTAYGENFNQLLTKLGAPAGHLQNNPPVGSLPASWPQW